MTGRDAMLEAGPLSSSIDRAGAFVLRHPLALTLVVLPLALLLGSIAGYAFGQAGGYRAERLKAVSDDLAHVRGDYLLAAGDSHIERWPARALCGLPLVNAGVSGSTAASYGAFLAELPLFRPPRAIILTIGTNDANEKRIRDVSDGARRFEHGFRPLLAWLRKTAPLVVLTGVPKIDPDGAEGFSAQAAEKIAAVARSVCTTSPGCVMAGTPGTGVARIDGVHFGDYAAAYRGIGQEFCATLLRELRAGTGR